MDLDDERDGLEIEDRKQIFITDDNYDQEFEKLCDENGFSYGQDNEFVKQLPDGFQKQQNDNGYEEWCKVAFSPNHAIDCASQIEEYWMAYEFANGFIIIYDRSSLFD